MFIENSPYSIDEKKIAIVIQARMDSTRLPGKALSDFCGKPMLKFQLDLLRRNNLYLDTIVATSTNEENDKIEELCNDNMIQCIRGDENNVYDRFCKVAQQCSLNHIIRLTGDNPLPSLDVIKACMTTHLKAVPDLTSTRRVMEDGSVKRYVPKGLSVDILNCKTLLRVDQSALNDYEKECVIPVFFLQKLKVDIVRDIDIDLPELSVDTTEDHKRVSIFAKNLLMKDQLFHILGYQ